MLFYLANLSESITLFSVVAPSENVFSCILFCCLSRDKARPFYLFVLFIAFINYVLTTIFHLKLYFSFVFDYPGIVFTQPSHQILSYVNILLLMFPIVLCNKTLFLLLTLKCNCFVIHNII